MIDGQGDLGGASAVSSLVRMPLGGYLSFLAANDRRPLWQARQARQASGFGQR